MKPTQFKKLYEATTFTQIISIIPKEMLEDPHWGLQKHLERQYADMFKVDYNHALAWTKASVGRLLYANKQQQRALNPLANKGITP